MVYRRITIGRPLDTGHFQCNTYRKTLSQSPFIAYKSGPIGCHTARACKIDGRRTGRQIHKSSRIIPKRNTKKLHISILQLKCISIAPPISGGIDNNIPPFTDPAHQFQKERRGRYIHLKLATRFPPGYKCWKKIYIVRNAAKVIFDHSLHISAYTQSPLSLPVGQQKTRNTRIMKVLTLSLFKDVDDFVLTVFIP